MVEVGLLLVGFIFWYVLYGIECMFDDRAIDLNPAIMHFPLLWQEFTWLGCGGRHRKLMFCRGNPQLADELPGCKHFLCVHIFLTIAPLMLYKLI